MKSDPGYADAWACLCDIYLDEYRFNYNPRPQSAGSRSGRGAAGGWLRPYQPSCASRVGGLCISTRQELDAFFAEAERAIALNPNHALYLGLLGRILDHVVTSGGSSLVRKAMKLDPFLPRVVNTSRSLI